MTQPQVAAMAPETQPPAGSSPNGLAAQPYPSMTALRAEHTHLQEARRSAGSAGDTLEFQQAAAEFVQRGVATGVYLDNDDDRRSAQGLLDYWGNVLDRAGFATPDTTLAEFDIALAPELRDDKCPYVGLSAFSESQCGLFFGREGALEAMLAKLKDSSFLAVVGSSGSGKSSLVRAGLLPALRAGALPGSADWRYLPPMVPGPRPTRALEPALAGSAAGDAPPGTAAEPAARTVLVIDQFEEAFTLCTDEEERARFIKRLVALVAPTPAAYVVVVTMRSDFEDRVARSTELQALFNRANVRLVALNAAELRDAIEKPAALVGLKFEAGVVDALIGDILGEPAALPLLQFSLMELWKQRERNRVTWETYRRVGGGRQALAKAANEFYNNKLLPEEQMTARRILLKMVRPTEGLEVTSNRILRSSIYKAGEAPDRVDRVLDKLLAARLVRLTEGEAPEDAQIEVAHEALVRNWPLLVEWLEDEREVLRRRLRLTADAERWRALNRDASALRRGALLEEALRYEDLNAVEQEFVQASQAQEESEAHARELARQRELDQAHTQLELERAQARTVRRATLMVTVLAVVAVCAAAVAIWQGILAYQAQRQSRSRELAAVARNQMQEDPSRAGLLAALAVQEQHTVEADDALRTVSQGPLVYILRGHKLNVSGAQFSADGRLILTTSDDWTARVWDARTGEQVAVMGSQDDPVLRAVFSPDSQHVLTFGYSPTVSLRDARSGEPVREMVDEFRVALADFSPDGTRIATLNTRGALRIWDAGTGELLRTIQGHSGELNFTNVQFSDDDQRIVTSGVTTATVWFTRLWSVEDGRELGAITSTVPLFTVQIAPRSGRILTIHNNRELMLWQVSSAGELISQTVPVGGSVYAASFSPDESFIVVSDRVFSRLLNADSGEVVALVSGQAAHFSADGQLLLTVNRNNALLSDGRTGAELITLSGHQDTIASAQFSPDGKWVVTAGADDLAMLWNIDPANTGVTALGGHQAFAYSARLSSDGAHLVTAGADGATRLWNVATITSDQLITSFIAAKWTPIWDAQFSPDGRRMLARSNDTVWVWDVPTATLHATLTHSGTILTSAQFSPDSKQVATAGWDQTARVWDVATGRELLILRGHSGHVTSVTFSRDGRQIATTSTDWTTRLWDAQTGESLRVLRGHTGAVMGAQFSPDGVWLVTASADRTARVWLLMLGRTTAVLQGHTAPLNSVEFSPKGNLIVTTSDDNTARVWDVLTGRLIALLTGHTAGITVAHFSPDGARIVTGSNDRTARVWDALSGEGISILRGAEGSVWDAQFAPDGLHISTASGDGIVRLYPTDAQFLVTTVHAKVRRALSCDEMRQFLHQICPTTPTTAR